MSDALPAERRSREPWWFKGVIPLVVTGFVVGLVAWGATTQTVAEHTKKIERLEALADVVIDLRAQVRFLYEAEQRRQAGR